MEKRSGNAGITLIALVITIIVLLILAGVSIAMLSGDNSILANAKKAKKDNALGDAREQVVLAIDAAITDHFSKKYNEGQESDLHTAVEDVLKDLEVKVSDIEYKYESNKVTITYTPDSDKVTGTLDAEGKFSWD